MSSRFTPDARATVLAALRHNATLGEAAWDAGVAEDTLKGWLKRGRAETDTEYSAFAGPGQRGARSGGRGSKEEPSVRPVFQAR